MNPCDTCAFRTGAAAHSEVYNRLRAQICAITGVPFWCHHGFDWKTKSKYITRAEFRERGMRICQGWRDEVRKHVKPGLEGALRRLIRRSKGEAILRMIERFIGLSGKSKKAKAAAHAELEAAIRSLHAEEGFK